MPPKQSPREDTVQTQDNRRVSVKGGLADQPPVTAMGVQSQEGKAGLERGRLLRHSKSQFIHLLNGGYWRCQSHETVVSNE